MRATIMIVRCLLSYQTLTPYLTCLVGSPPSALVLAWLSSLHRQLNCGVQVTRRPASFSSPVSSRQVRSSLTVVSPPATRCLQSIANIFRLKSLRSVVLKRSQAGRVRVWTDHNDFHLVAPFQSPGTSNPGYPNCLSKIYFCLSCLVPALALAGHRVR
jgi:hypothetical protein